LFAQVITLEGLNMNKLLKLFVCVLPFGKPMEVVESWSWHKSSKPFGNFMLGTRQAWMSMAAKSKNINFLLN
jgi:hypothetical protein